MTPERFAQYVKSLSLGKRLPDSVYLHRSAFEATLPELAHWLQQQTISEFEWSVIKLSTRHFGASLLDYPQFYEAAYPALRSSMKIDFAAGSFKTTQYRSSNPPILHRKETMVLPDDPAHGLFCEITAEGEAAGLYDNPKIIGFQQTWHSLIRDKGFELIDGRLIPTVQAPTAQPTIERHRTAISRDALSAPMKTLARNGYLDGDYSLFDYGCGRGDDLRELEAHGLEVSGWDPNWRPDGIKRTSDVVNLGYVINVIEDLRERVEALSGAWALTSKLLVVSAMIAGEEYINKFRGYKDGVITSRNTFQKYYAQNELQHFIEQVLDDEPIAVGPGIFYLFKDKDEEQLYLANKLKRARPLWRQLSQKPLRIPRSELLFVEYGEQLEQFWERCLDLGRLPAAEELSGLETLTQAVGSPKKIFTLLLERYSRDDFDRAATERRDDLLIYFALQQFSKRKPYKHMPEPLKRDIKALFDDYKTCQALAQALLFSLGAPEGIYNACLQAQRTLPACVFDDGHSLTLHVAFINDLPPMLRLYISCGTMLYGELDEIDLVKIHIRSGKLSLMKYAGFSESPIPLLLERIKINLRRQQIHFFDYQHGDYAPQPLYGKSALIDERFADFAKQKSFDKKLASLELPGMEGYGLDLETLTEVLKHGYELVIRGYRFYRLRSGG